MRRAFAALVFTTALILPGTVAGEETINAVPTDLRGTWGRDCARPNLRLAERTIAHLPERRVGAVHRVARNGDRLEIHYRIDGDTEPSVDLYIIEATSLRHEWTRRGGTQTAGDRAEWRLCVVGDTAAAGAPATST